MKTSNISISLILTILSFNQEKGFGFVTRSSSTYVPTTKFASKTSRYRQHVVVVASSESSEDMEDMSKQEKLKPIILKSIKTKPSIKPGVNPKIIPSSNKLPHQEYVKIYPWKNVKK